MRELKEQLGVTYAREFQENLIRTFNSKLQETTFNSKLQETTEERAMKRVVHVLPIKMKFGKLIQNHENEFGSQFLMNYKQLKKALVNETLFFYKLERELEMVNEFYLKQEFEFLERLKELLLTRFVL